MQILDTSKHLSTVMGLCALSNPIETSDTPAPKSNLLLDIIDKLAPK